MAIKGAAPRKKPKGEAAIRAHLIGSTSERRPVLAVIKVCTGSGRSGSGDHAPCSFRVITLRQAAPLARRAATVATDGRGAEGGRSVIAGERLLRWLSGQ